MNKLIFITALIGTTVIGKNFSTRSEIKVIKVVLSDSTEKKVIDPVCKMKIRQEGSKSSTFNKITYYFCSALCKQSFDATPAKYIKK